MASPVGLSMSPDLLVAREDVRRGKTCYVAQSSALSQILREEFGREDLCLKVFHKLDHTQTEVKDPDGYRWAMDVPLTTSTKVQNLFAREDLSPRVYAIRLINGRLLAQVTDFLEPARSEPQLDQLEEIKSRLHVGLKWDYGAADFDAHEQNWVGRKLVDFGGACFQESREYERSLTERARALTRQGKLIFPPHPYLPISEFSAEGLRGPMANRYEALHFDEIDFEGKTVLDLGCNNGAFCREMARRGARRVVGLDMSPLPGVAFELSNWLGFWNLDFFSVKLPVDTTRVEEKCGIGKFDVVLALSVLGHVKGHYRSWVADLCAGLFFLEGHDRENEATYREQLSADFGTVDYLGIIQDGGRRPIFRCHL